MGEVIEYEKYKAARIPYNEIIRDLRKSLDSAADEIYDSCVYLAMLCAWKDWNNALPLDVKVEIGEEALNQTSDKNVSALIYLYRTIIDTLEWLPFTDNDASKVRPNGVVGHICNDKVRERAMSDPIVNDAVKMLNAQIVGIIIR